jgi:hypothetical protein
MLIMRNFNLGLRLFTNLGAVAVLAVLSSRILLLAGILPLPIPTIKPI